VLPQGVGAAAHGEPAITVDKNAAYAKAAAVTVSLPLPEM
jgi:hypothetical protein